jgi:phage repressor protein C with HTH and peptisase S24 domain
MTTLSHAQIWSAIDALAARLGMAPSALARLAGLDPTSFNRSKRVSSETPPRPRWPSTESLAKVLLATDTSLAQFAALAQGEVLPAQGHLPLLGFDAAALDGHFDAMGFPSGEAWDTAAFPGLAEDGAYALEITGRALEPIYRPGDRIVISPGLEARAGDRVVVKMASGALVAKQVASLTQTHLALAPLGDQTPDHTLDLEDVVWVSRIVWASQ